MLNSAVEVSRDDEKTYPTADARAGASAPKLRPQDQRSGSDPSRVSEGASTGVLSTFAGDVRAGLGQPGQKSLPSSYLYDAVGSALFETITVLPEYGVTRAEERLLQRHAQHIAAAFVEGDVRAATTRAEPRRVVELGSGTGTKTRFILEALAQYGEIVYCPIDISKTALDQCCRSLADIPNVRIEPFEDDYLAGLASVSKKRPAREQTLLLFLGSTIGNFPKDAALSFLAALKANLQKGDALLLGTDLLKPEEILLRAYDDEVGVTAAFNRNLLARMNRELGADFSLDGFIHVARFNPDARSVEMHLQARHAQDVHIAAANLDVSFTANETIWTESSHKYDREDAMQMGRDAGFVPVKQWTDTAWPFAETLLAVQ
jgi:dimethylhistidine N-methyltransferase